MFEVILLDLLPSNTKDAALRCKTLDEMAAAVDIIMAQNPGSSVAEVEVQQDVLAVHNTRAPATAARKTGRGDRAPQFVLCASHARFGEKTYKCMAPDTCPMKGVTVPRPAPGNAKAGRQ